MINEKVIGITADAYQRRRLKLPKGDVKLGDGRTLRRRIGYDLRKIAGNTATRLGFLDNAGWLHAPTGFAVAASIDDTRFGPLLHVSMSYQDHAPTWEEIKLVKDAYYPRDMDAMMMLPREADYVNMHSYCFHLIQVPFEWGIR